MESERGRDPDVSRVGNPSETGQDWGLRSIGSGDRAASPVFAEAVGSVGSQRPQQHR